MDVDVTNVNAVKTKLNQTQMIDLHHTITHTIQSLHLVQKHSLLLLLAMIHCHGHPLLPHHVKVVGEKTLGPVQVVSASPVFPHYKVKIHLSAVHLQERRLVHHLE